MSDLFDLGNYNTEYHSGTQAGWDLTTVPVPKDVIVITTDTYVVKIGNGSDIFSDLPIAVTFASWAEGKQYLIDMFVDFPTNDDKEHIVYVGNKRYTTGGISVDDITNWVTQTLADLVGIEDSISASDTVFTFLDEAIPSKDDYKLIVSEDGLATTSVSIDNIYDIMSDSQDIHLKGYKLYSDPEGINEIKILTLDEDNYIKFDYLSDTLATDRLVITLTSSDGSGGTLTYSQVDVGVFKIDPPKSGIFTVSINNGSSSISRNIQLELASLYGLNISWDGSGYTVSCEPADTNISIYSSNLPDFEKDDTTLVWTGNTDDLNTVSIPPFELSERQYFKVTNGNDELSGRLRELIIPDNDVEALKKYLSDTVATSNILSDEVGYYSLTKYSSSSIASIPLILPNVYNIDFISVIVSGTNPTNAKSRSYLAILKEGEVPSSSVELIGWNDSHITKSDGVSICSLTYSTINLDNANDLYVPVDHVLNFDFDEIRLAVGGWSGFTIGYHRMRGITFKWD